MFLNEDQGSVFITIMFASLGGYVEAIGYTKLFGLFIGPMSGNTVVLATSAGQGEGAMAATRAATIALFLFGVVLGVSVRQILRRFNIPHAASVLFVGEAICLLIFFAVGTFVISEDDQTPTGWSFYALMPPAVLSMAIQSGLIRKVGNLAISSTIVTGTLTNVATELANIGFALYDKKLGRPVKLNVRDALSRTGILFGVWLLYLVGALLGEFGFRRIDLYSLLPAIGLLCFLAVVDFMNVRAVIRRHSKKAPVEESRADAATPVETKSEMKNDQDGQKPTHSDDWV